MTIWTSFYVGTIIGFVHDWANPEDTFRSWDMVARYVVPEINGYLAGLRKSQFADGSAFFVRHRSRLCGTTTFLGCIGSTEGRCITTNIPQSRRTRRRHIS